MEYTIHPFNAGGFVMYPLVLFMLAKYVLFYLKYSYVQKHQS